MSLFIIDPSSGAGIDNHFFYLNQLFSERAAARGEACHIGVGRNVTEQYRALLPAAEGVFDNDSTRFAEQLEAFVGPRARDGDTIFCHSITHGGLAVLASFLDRRRDQRLRLRVILRREPWFQSVPTPVPAPIVYGIELDRLASMPQHDVRFLADSEAMRDLYAVLTSFPVEAIRSLPIELPDRLALSGVEPADPDRPVFFLPGQSRDEKGLELVAAVMPKILSRHRQARFRFHDTGGGLDFNMVDRRTGERRTFDGAERIEVIKGALSKTDFYPALASASCVLTAYNPVAYRYRTSHIVVEALGLGRPVIVVEGSWLAREARSVGTGGVIYAKSYTSAAMEAAIEAFLAERERFTREAELGAPTWRALHNPEATVAAVLES